MLGGLTQSEREVLTGLLMHGVKKNVRDNPARDYIPTILTTLASAIELEIKRFKGEEV